MTELELLRRKLELSEIADDMRRGLKELCDMVETLERAGLRDQTTLDIFQITYSAVAKRWGDKERTKSTPQT